MATKNTTTAVTVAKSLSSEELTTLLQEAGWAEKPGGDSLPRMGLQGNMLTTPDGGMFVYNPARPKVPAMSVRIVKPPEEYFAIYLNEKNAQIMGRPDLGNTFSKRYIHSDPNRRVWDSDAAFDDVKSFPGLFDDYGNALKQSWKADILLQIIPEDGNLTGSEVTYVLTLATTSLIEFKGTSRAPDAGAASEFNFIRKLSLFALENMEEGTDPKRAVLDALTSLTLGGVAADVRILPMSNKEKGQTWSVISFDPIHIEPMQQGDNLLAEGDLTQDPDEVAL